MTLREDTLRRAEIESARQAWEQALQAASQSLCYPLVAMVASRGTMVPARAPRGRVVGGRVARDAGAPAVRAAGEGTL